MEGFGNFIDGATISRVGYRNQRKPHRFEVWSFDLTHPHFPTSVLKFELWKQDPVAPEKRKGFIPVPHGEDSEFNIHLEARERINRKWHRMSNIVYRWGKNPGKFGDAPPSSHETIRRIYAAAGYTMSNALESKDTRQWPLAIVHYHIPQPISDKNLLAPTTRKFFERTSITNHAFRQNVRTVLEDLLFRPTARERIAGLRMGGTARNWRKFIAAAKRELAEE